MECCIVAHLTHVHQWLLLRIHGISLITLKRFSHEPFSSTQNHFHLTSVCFLSQSGRGFSLNTAFHDHLFIPGSTSSPHHFPCSFFSSQHSRSFEMSKERKNNFRCAAFEWNENFSLEKENYSKKKRKQNTKRKRILKCSWRHDTELRGENRCEPPHYEQERNLFYSARNVVKVPKAFYVTPFISSRVCKTVKFPPMGSFCLLSFNNLTTLQAAARENERKFCVSMREKSAPCGCREFMSCKKILWAC